MYINLAILSIFVFLYSLVSGGLEKTPYSGAIIFTLFGLVFGPLGLGILNLEVNVESLMTLAELTLSLVLFTDAANANFHELKKSYNIPVRLLPIGLPLTILLGFGVGVLLFNGMHLPEIALLATEGTGDNMALITWVIFGAVVIGQSIGSLSWEIVLYSLLSLTLIRMVPYSWYLPA